MARVNEVIDANGVDCAVCGCKRANVAHHTPEYRANPSNPHAVPRAEQGGKDYYTWANVPFHEFQEEHVHWFRCECGAELERLTEARPN